MATNTSEATRIEASLTRAREQASEAAAELASISELCEHATGEALSVDDGLRLLGMAYEARHDAVWAAEEADRCLGELFQQVNLARQEVSA